MGNKKGYLKRSTEVKQKEKYLLLFVVAYLGMLITFIPTMIANDGIFLYYGDFNSQQMMFYEHANEMVRNGNMAWDWGTDLGANFIGSYSFYLLGSPFFWLSTLFPLKAVPFLMPWLLSLKTAVAAISAYAYIRRFVKDTNACFVGAMLYAFSGFQAYNVFFNHFHDVTAFFPLLLLGIELLVQDKKKGAFALAVGICATISYFFFVCEVVFCIIYFVIRCTDKEFKIDIKTFGLLAFEAVLGVMLSAIILLPACIDVFTNPRLDERLYGLDMVFYSENVRIPRIIQAFFMMSDMPARINILHSDKANWASIAGYLPLFSMCGVIAFFRTIKKHWASKLVIVCTIMACIPILNSSFVLFNSSYYARWYYMPILIMCLMTAKVIAEHKDSLKKGFIPVAVVAGFFLLVGALPKLENDEVVFFKVPDNMDLYKIQFGITVTLTFVLGLIVYLAIENKEFGRLVALVTSAACVVTMFAAVNYGAAQGSHYKYIDDAIYGKEDLDMDKLNAKYTGDNTFYRIDTSENVDNWCMFWGLSSMRTFHSVVPTSILDFYHSINQTRDVASRMETTLYALRGLFSVRYYFEQVNDTNSNYPPDYHANLVDFKYVDTQNNFNIYENEHWLPMGFAYDQYTTDNVIKSTNDIDKTNILLEAMVLDDQQIAKYSNVITRYDDQNSPRDKESYKTACADRRAQSCYYFKEDTNGFDAKINLENGDRLVFFSVPYEDGWSATVNGKEAEIEKVSYGFMAVLCHNGENEIKFHYETTGLAAGKIITVTGFIIFFVYAGTNFYYVKKKKKAEDEKARLKPARKKK